MVISWFRSKLTGGAQILQQGFRQFPMAWTCSAVAAALMIACIHVEHANDRLGHALLAGLGSALLGVLLAMAHGIAARDGMSTRRLRLLAVGIVLACTGYGLWTYQSLSAVVVPEQVWMQSSAFFVGAFCLVMLARARVWWGSETLHNWLMQMAQALAMAWLMSTLLAGGITLTLLSVNALFDLNVSSHVYGDVWCLAGFLFGITYLLGAVSENWELGTLHERARTQLLRLVEWVGRPLLVVYFLVMFAYACKIALAAELPRGVISTMVVCYGVIGLGVSLLLVWLQTGSQPLWSRLFAMTFVIPLALFIVAMHRRVLDYGWTESRIAWVALIVIVLVGGVTAARKGAQALLATLIVLLFISIGFGLGDFGLCGIARMSQVHRIDAYYAQAGSWKAINDSNARQVKEIVQHLSNRYGKATLARWLNAEQLTKLDSLGAWNHGEQFLRQVGIDPSRLPESSYHSWEAVDSLSNFSMQGMRECAPFRVDSWMTRNDQAGGGGMLKEHRFLVSGHRLPPGLFIDLQPLADSLRSANSNYIQKGPAIAFEQESDSLQWRVFINALHQNREKGLMQINHAAGLACWGPSR